MSDAAPPGLLAGTTQLILRSPESTYLAGAGHGILTRTLLGEVQIHPDKTTFFTRAPRAARLEPFRRHGDRPTP